MTTAHRFRRGLVLELAPAPSDPDSAHWLRDLQGPGGEAAYERLHRLLLRVARGELRRRGPRAGITGPELDDLAHQAAADALVAVRRKLPGFRGESRFTTWAYKFVILEVSTKLGRHFWRTPRVRLDADDWSRLPDRSGLDPVAEHEGRELVAALRDAVGEVLSERQREAFVAVVLNEVPADALADRLGTSRNAIYKILYDARGKLRAQLVATGHLDARTAAGVRSITHG
jgi:RNA polymerase sigma-70 factor (ECF subfamily)